MKTKKTQQEGFDDCYVCRAMKSGEANIMLGLKKVCEKARKTGIGKTGMSSDFYKKP